MNDHQLLCFLTVSRTLNFTTAARELYCTQPALSYQIRSLEKELDLALFERSTTRVALTEAGRAFVPQAEGIYRSILNARTALKGFARQRTLTDLAGQQLFYEPLYQEMVDLAVVQPGLPFSAPSWHMVENYECVYNDLLAGRGMFLCPMKYPAFPAAWYLPLQLPLPDTCLLTLRDDPRPEIQRLREVFTAVYASRAKLLGEE